MRFLCFNTAFKMYCRGTFVLLKFWTYSISHLSKLKACSRQRKISFQMAPNCVQSTTNCKFYIYTFSVKYTVNSLLYNSSLYMTEPLQVCRSHFPLMIPCRRPVRKAKLNKTVANSARLCTIFQRAEWDLFEEMQINSQEVTCLGTRVCVTDGAL